MVVVLVFLVAWVITLVIALPLRLLAIRARWLDHPGDRKLQPRPVPYLGGLAVFLGATLALHLVTPSDTFSPTLYACGVAMFLLGLVDDLHTLRPLSKLSIQAAAALALLAHGHTIERLLLPGGYTIPLGLAAYPFSFLWFIGLTNAFNLIDGLDGLLSTIGALSLLGCAAVGVLLGHLGPPPLAAALAGALLGFLPWNWSPARMFLGDSGSLPIGLFAATLSLEVTRGPQGGVHLHLAAALCFLPVAETLLTVLRRHVANRPYFAGDRRHLHHVLLARHPDPRRVVATLGTLQAAFVAAAALSCRWPTASTLLALTSLALAARALRRLRYPELRVLIRELRRGRLPDRRRLAALLAVAEAGDRLADAPHQPVETPHLRLLLSDEPPPDTIQIATRNARVSAHLDDDLAQHLSDDDLRLLLDSSLDGLDDLPTPQET